MEAQIVSLSEKLHLRNKEKDESDEKIKKLESELAEVKKNLADAQSTVKYASLSEVQLMKKLDVEIKETEGLKNSNR